MAVFEGFSVQWKWRCMKKIEIENDSEIFGLCS